MGIKLPNYVPQQDAHIHCKYGHHNVMPIFTAGCPYFHRKYWHWDAHIHVNIGVGVPIFA